MRKDSPVFTIAVSYRNRDTENLVRMLESLRNQDFKDFEVILVDYGSSLDYSRMVKDALKEYKFVRYIYTDTRGHAWSRAIALNIAARNANSEYFMTTDIDMFFPSNFLNIYAKHVRENRVLYCNHYFLPENFRDWKDIDNYTAKLPRDQNKGRGASMCVSLGNFLKIRGHDESFIFWNFEDADLNKRLKNFGLEELWLSDQTHLFHQWHSYKDPRFPAENEIFGRAVPVGLWSKSCKNLLMLQNRIVCNNDNWGEIIETKHRAVLKYIDLETNSLLDKNNITVLDFTPNLNESIHWTMRNFEKLLSGQALLIPNSEFPKKNVLFSAIIGVANFAARRFNFSSSISYSPNLLHAFIIDFVHQNPLISDYYLNLPLLNGAAIMVKS